MSVVFSAAVPRRLLSSVLRQQVPVDGLVQSHTAGQDLGQLALRHVQTGRAQILRDVHHSHDPRKQHGSRMNHYYITAPRQQHGSRMNHYYITDPRQQHGSRMNHYYITALLPI